MLWGEWKMSTDKPHRLPRLNADKLEELWKPKDLAYHCKHDGQKPVD